MKVTFLEKRGDEEDEIIVKCAKIDENLMEILRGIQSGGAKLSFYKGSKIVLVDENAVFYFESVDDRVFGYTADGVFEVKFKLYELEEWLSRRDFFRANKATIVNLSKIAELSPAFGGRFEAKLKNGMRVIVSRNFVPKLKEKLGL